MRVRHLPLRARRPAFTLIEMLVVISIIAVLAAIAIPAVMKAREAATRIECTNNLRQLGVACHAYHQEMGYYPTAGYDDFSAPWFVTTGTGLLTTPVAGWQQHAGWGYQILPYLGEDNAWTGGAASSSPATQAANPMKQAIKFFLCPSRRNLTTYTYTNPLFPFEYTPQAGTYTMAPCDFAACNGNVVPAAGVVANNGMVLTTWDGSTTWNPPPAGTSKPLRNVVRAEDVLDGASYTMLLGEKAANVNLSASSRIPNEDDMGFAAAFHHSNFNTIRFATQTLLPLRDLDITTTNNYPTGGCFGSIHPGTFNVLMADGAVARIPYKIDPLIYAAIGSRNGHEQVSDLDLAP
jgi:prepilin-type N-terminal cleavage/methylation domain-containing protein/prepilin-type processing-associated H-X9-DG protein